MHDRTIRLPLALFMLITLATATAASAVTKAVGVEGSANVSRRAGGETPLTVGTMLSVGDVVTTGARSSAALAFMATAGTPESESDLFILGPDSAVEIASATATSGAPMVVRVRKGSYRAVVRNPGDTAHFDVEAGDYVVNLEAADAGGSYSPGTGNAKFLCRKGALAIKKGKRNIKLKSGMYRAIDRGKVLGARRLADGQWDEATGACTVKGVDVSQPDRVAKRPPAGVPTETRTPTEILLGAGGATSKKADTLPTTRGTLSPPPSSSSSAGSTTATGADLEYVKLSTSMGDIVIELDRTNAPISVENFLGYVDRGFYNGTIFHRVMSNFMIQGGGFGTGLEKLTTGPPITNEWQNGLKNVRGSVAMARLGRQPDSATSQFFINVVDNAGLDTPRDGAGYAVFGKVILGMDVVDAIRVVETTTKGRYANVPATEVLIESAERTSKEALE